MLEFSSNHSDDHSSLLLGMPHLLGWKPWDYCAGMVIAEEAGCIMRSLKGDGKVKEFDDEGKVILDSKFDIYSDSMICGVNTTVVEQCRNVVLGISTP